MVTKELKLLKFGADFCGPCRSMERNKILEKLVEKHPYLDLEVVDVEDKDGEELANDYDIAAIPTFVFEDLEGNELYRAEGATSISGLEKMLKKAKDALEDEDEDPEDEDPGVEEDEDEDEEDPEDGNDEK